MEARRNVLLEGPVGVGKTRLALEVVRELGLPVFRVDGDSRYSEQKLTGWFDPPTVLKKGFVAETFLPGPLVEAMRSGGILFINELNRMPEGVQNVLLPAIDEGKIILPKLGEIQASEGFLVIATQNPKEFVGTSHLSEAILDRFELVVLDYQKEEEEAEIVSKRLRKLGATEPFDQIAIAAVKLARLTRGHPRVRRGASVRAAMGVAELAWVLTQKGMPFGEAFLSAAKMALPTRIEIDTESATDHAVQVEVERLIQELAQEASSGAAGKKKS